MVERGQKKTPAANPGEFCRYLTTVLFLVVEVFLVPVLKFIHTTGGIH